RLRDGPAGRPLLGEQPPRAGARARAPEHRGGARPLPAAADVPLSGHTRGADVARHPAAGALQRPHRHALHPGRGHHRTGTEARVALTTTPANRKEAWGRRVLALAVVTAVGFVGLVGEPWFPQGVEDVA